MIKHKLLLDTSKYSKKPEQIEISSINNRIIQHPVEITIEELSHKITQPNGHAWIPAHIEDKRKNENWKSQSIFALDFDSGITFHTVRERLKEYGLDCSFAYSTFSDSPEKPKFRVVFALGAVVINREYRNQIQLSLMNLFPEADNSCKDASRMFFGGRELIYVKYEYCLDQSELRVCTAVYATRDSKPSHLNQALKRLDKKLGGGQKCVKSGKTYIYNIAPSKINTQSPSKKELYKVNLNEIRNKIKILDDFMNGEWLYHPQLFGLATNLIHINGGSKLFKECLSLNPNYTQEKYNLTNIANYYNYSPTKLENFSPYEEDWIYSTLLKAGRNSEIIRILPNSTITLSSAEQEFNRLLEESLKAEDHKVYIFKVATGLGKTKAIEERENVVIAFPTHQLKDEVGKDRMKVKCKIIPELPDSLPQEVIDRLNQLYRVGATSEVNKFIHKKANDYEALKQYCYQLSSAITSCDTVLTTHDKALFIDFPNLNTIIFDEDPINKLLNIGSITKGNLLKLKEHLSNKIDAIKIDDLVTDIENDITNFPLKMKAIVFDNYSAVEEEIINNSVNYDGNLLNFFNSDFYVVDSHNIAVIYYIKKNFLPESKKIIILSATADRTFYEKLAGDRLEFYDLSNVELQGILIQDTNYTFSRASLRNNRCLEYALNKTKSHDAVITFKNYKKHFTNAQRKMHLGNVLGYDELKGKKVAVVGTPYENSVKYALFAACLGGKYKPSDFQMHHQTIKRNGIQFPIKTYKHEGLRNIHLSLMEAELRQAIGRARLLREPGEVLLLSGLPLPEAHLNDEEIAEGRKLI